MSKTISPHAVLIMAVLLMVACPITHAQQNHSLTPQQQAVVSNYWAHAGGPTREAFQITDGIQVESTRSKHLTADQIKTLDKYVADPNILVRIEVMAALPYAGAAEATSAAVVARKGFDSQDSTTRMFALRALDQLNAPDIVSVAKGRLNDPSRSVTAEAHRILKKRGVEK